MTLLLTTTLCAMLIAARGLPPFWLVAVTMLGGVLAAGGANVLNCFIDRDIDAQMTRTRNRAIAAGRVSPHAALAFGVTLTVASVLVLGVVGQLDRRRARPGRKSLLRLRLHEMAQADDALQHRHRRRRRRRAAAGRLGGGDGRSLPAGLGTLRHHLRLDAAPLLGAGACSSRASTPAPPCRCCRSSAAKRRRAARS